MSHLERCLLYFLTLILCSAVPLQSQIVTTKAPIEIERNSTNLRIHETNAPAVFPKEEVNGTKIINSKTTLKDTSSLSLINSRVQIQTNSSNANSEILTNANINDTNFNTTAINNTEVGSNSNSTNENDTATVYDTVRDTIVRNTTEIEAGISSNNKVNNSQSQITVPHHENAVVSNDSSKIDTEASDMNSSTHLDPKPIPDFPPNITFNGTQQIDTETELTDDGQNTEDILRQSHADSLSTPGVPLVQGQLAAILAGVFVAISVLAYIALLSWRRYLENRYGNRQMLVNEEEFSDDIRHFSI